MAMLSILIPVHNYSCSKLAEDLSSQIRRYALEAEIIVAEDGSDEEHKVCNRGIAKLPYCFYVEFLENKGRSKIRNSLAGMAKGEWLVFIDCDAEVIDGDFVKRYYEISLNGGDADIYCGGLDVKAPDDLSAKSLRYYYSLKREKRSAAERMSSPYSSFSSFNFMIRTSVFFKYPFDESFIEYGHEDTLFGDVLRDNGVKLKHIDNPLYHNGLELNEIFLSKTERSIESLYKFRDKLFNCSRLYQFYAKLKRFHVLFLCRCFYLLFGSKVRKYLLESKNPSIVVFDLYKLGYLSVLPGKRV